MSSPIQCGRPWLPFLLTVRHWCYTFDPTTVQFQGHFLGIKPAIPLRHVSVRWEILKSTLPRSATQVLPIFVNATKHVVCYRRPSQPSLTAAAPSSDYCQSLCKPESTWFRFICRFFLENGQERKYLEWEIWPENRQNQNKVVIAAFPIEFHGVQNSKEATSLSGLASA